MSDIGFKNIPANVRTPLFYAELDASNANSPATNQRALIIGQITDDGTAVPNIPVLSQGSSDAKSIGGPGSMLALMTAAYKANDGFGEVWYLPLSDDDDGVAAAGTISIDSAPTVNGVVALYVAGQRLSLAVTAAQTAAQIATALAAAITAAIDLPVAAAVDEDTATLVNVIAKNAGLAGNDIDIRLNYLGTAGGETLPTGLGVTITPMASGATNPDLATALTNCGDQPFDFIVLPYTDATSLNAMKAFLNDQTGRWSYADQVYGHAFCGFRGTSSACVTLGSARNDPHATIMGYNDSPTPSWLWSPALAGAAAASLRSDPGVPLQTLALAGVLAPPLQSRFVRSQRETLLNNGIATFTVADDGTVAIERCITTYQENSFGQPDTSYLDIETLFVLMTVLRRQADLVTSKYARKKLAADGTRFGPNTSIITPAVIRADLVAQYQEMEAEGLVQNSAAFAAALVVQKNSTNPNRVDVLWPGTLIDQLRIFALLAQFRLQ
ncbi:MAG TPA: phage tail sheath subtilisin-like domain-containing protein [Rhizomicrobium sp.]|jgi:phage tail sheath gpL-like|nr:phage tail sheath subtilisin-like domain-containing protein [Rhizomicrobium sp.]